MIRFLTAVFIWAILWFCVVAWIGLRFHDPALRDSLPGLYIGGNVIYAVLLAFNKSRKL